MKKYIAVLAAVCASLIQMGCSSTGEDNSVRMGVILPHGESSDKFTSEFIENGMRLAMTEINQSGGINGKQLNLVFENTKDSSHDTMQAADRLIHQNIRFLHVGLGNQVVKINPELNKVDNVFVNYLSAYPPAVVSGKNSVRIFLNAAQEGDIIGKAIKVEGSEDVRALIMNADDYVCKSAAAYIAFQTGLKNERIYKDVYKRDENYFDIFASQIERLRPQYLINYGYGNELNSLLLSLSNKNYKGIVITNCATDEIKSYQYPRIKLKRLCTNFELGKVKTDASLKFKAVYKKLYGKEPIWAAAYGYDSIKLFAEAIKISGQDTAKAKEYFTNRTCYGAIGTITFDSAGDSISELTLVENE